MLAALGQREQEVGGGVLPADACTVARRRAAWMIVAAAVIGVAIAALAVLVPGKS